MTALELASHHLFQHHETFVSHVRTFLDASPPAA